MTTPVARKIEPISPSELGGLDPSRVLFVGMGASAVAWYRCILPAMYLGADWIGVSGEPPKFRFHTGLVKGRTSMPDWKDYDAVVLQQPRGRAWHRLIRSLQSEDIAVLFEVDDYLHAIRKMGEDHDFASSFDKAALAELELCMRQADGIITSTEFIARRYLRFNSRTWVAQNGVDLGRYAVTRPDRPTFNVGWAGGTGHTRSFREWVPAVERVMERHADVCFVSIGQDFGAHFAQRFGQHRAISVPFTMIDNYPAAMTLFDVALAPAGRGNFFRGKSDLRWVEAGALGVPAIADPSVYPAIRDGLTGFHASDVEDLEEKLELLVGDRNIGIAVGSAARDEIHDTRGMHVTARRWAEVLVEVIERRSGKTSLES